MGKEEVAIAASVAFIAILCRARLLGAFVMCLFYLGLACGALYGLVWAVKWCWLHA